MALGNALELKFRITSDSSQAQKDIKEIGTATEQAAKAAVDPLKTLQSEFDALRTRGDAVAGRINALKDASSDLAAKTKQTTQAFTQQIGPIGSLIGNLTGLNTGLITSAARLGVVGIAVVAVGSAIKGLVEITQGMIGAAEEIGSKSKEDFDAFKKSVEAAGGEVTKLDQVISQQLLKSLDGVKGAADRMFTELLRIAGPALIVLLNDVKTLLGEIENTKVGVILTNAFLLASAAVKTFIQILKGDVGAGADLLLAFVGNFIIAQSELNKLNQELSKTQATAFKGQSQNKAALKDLTEQQLELNQLARALREATATRDAEVEAIREGLGTEIGSWETYYKRRIQIENEFLQRLDANFDRQKQIIEESAKLPREKTDALEALETRRADAIRDSIARQIAAREESTKAIEREIDRMEALYRKDFENAEEAAKKKQEALKRLEFTEKEVADVIEARIRQQAALEEARLRVRQELQLQDPASNINIFGVDPLGQATQFTAFKDSVLAGLGDITKSMGTFRDTAARAFGAAAAGAQQVLTAFILTGKIGGQALKKLAADVIAAITAESAVKALFYLAEGFANLFLNPPKAAASFTAAKIYGVVAGIGLAAAAIAGGFAGENNAVNQFGAQAQPPQETRFGTGERHLGVLGPEFFQQQQQLTTAVVELRGEVGGLREKLSSMSPGDVVTVGAQQQPAVISNAVVAQGRHDAEFINDFGRMILGSS